MSILSKTKILLLIFTGLSFSAQALDQCRNDILSELYPMPNEFPQEPTCGEPLLKATKKRNLQELSNENLNEMKSNSNESPCGKQISIREIYSKNPPFITHRFPKSVAEKILASGKLQSTSKVLNKTQKITTPQLENSLFGAFNCVFAAVGSPEGKARYGEVLIVFKESAQSESAWATPSSGWHFNLNSKKDHIGDFERKAFAKTAFTHKDWSEFFIEKIEHTLSNLPKEEKEKVCNEIQSNQHNRKELWRIVEAHQLGYLEAKYPNTINIEKDIESILVPEDIYNKIQSSDLKESYKQLIKPL